MSSGEKESGDNEGMFTAQEQEAVDFFRVYRDSICNTLRCPEGLKKEEEWSRFLVFLRNLDGALCKSSPGRSRLLFHGVRSEFCKKLLFLLDIPADMEKRATRDFIPHVLQDPSYITFTSRASTALERPVKSGFPQILFVYECLPEDSAMTIDESGDEVLFPRNSRWLTVGHGITESGITCIMLEKFTNGGNMK
jgi:hypothetical protein